MNKIITKIQENALLNTLLPVFNNGAQRKAGRKAQRKVFLVGGFLRDAYLDAPCSRDFDLVVLGECSKTFAEEIAQNTGGTLVELDPINNIHRVVVDGANIDITCCEDIEKDAKRRDFTLNSIYYDFSCQEIFDPQGGLLDLKNGILKTYDLTNFDPEKGDALRMLRAFRFMSVFNFTIHPDIVNYIKAHSVAISTVACERVHYELLKMFEGENLVETLRLAHNTGFLSEVFPFVREIEKIPKNSHHHLCLFDHCLETVRHIRLNNPLLKLAAFMHDIGKPETWKIESCELLDPNGNLITTRHRFIGHEEAGATLAKPILEHLKFSKKEIEFITMMIANHIYPSALMAQDERTDRAVIRFAKRTYPYTKELLELARADRLSARGVMVDDIRVEKNLANLEELGRLCEDIQGKMQTLPKLLDGREIMALLNLPPSGRLGEIISELYDAQLSGSVQNKEEALRFIEACKVRL